MFLPAPVTPVGNSLCAVLLLLWLCCCFPPVRTCRAAQVLHVPWRVHAAPCINLHGHRIVYCVCYCNSLLVHGLATARFGGRSLQHQLCKINDVFFISHTNEFAVRPVHRIAACALSLANLSTIPSCTPELARRQA